MLNRVKYFALPIGLKLFRSKRMAKSSHSFNIKLLRFYSMVDTARHTSEVVRHCVLQVEYATILSMTKTSKVLCNFYLNLLMFNVNLSCM